MNRLPSDLPEKLKILRDCRYFSGAKKNILQELAQETHLLRYEVGETIFREGEPCAGLHIIEKGNVKLYKISPQGREMIIRTFGAGDSFNEVPVFDQETNPISTAAITEVEVWVVTCEAIRRAMQAHPEMATSIILNLTKNLRMLVGLVEELSFYQVTHRLARLISQLPDEQLMGKGNQRLTQDEIAARLGTVREVVARSLKELERSGAIQINRRRIQIKDPAVLKDWAQLPE
jgi:CRP/FNR family transcriptional regulator